MIDQRRLFWYYFDQEVSNMLVQVKYPDNRFDFVKQNILDLFNENNIQIMTPAYEGDPAEQKVVPRDQWNTPLAKQ